MWRMKKKKFRLFQYLVTEVEGVDRFLFYYIKKKAQPDSVMTLIRAGCSLTLNMHT